MQGATPSEVQAKLGRIMLGAEPPASEQAVAELLADAGFTPPLRFFSSLFWGAVDHAQGIMVANLQHVLRVHLNMKIAVLPGDAVEGALMA